MAAADLAQLRREGGCFALRPAVRIRVTGTDRLRYLNGQVSNDLHRLDAGTACKALLLTARGKLCAVVFVWREADAHVVEADGIPPDDLLARLERYAIADDVAFEVLGNTEPRWHVFGPAASGRTGLRIRRMGEVGVDLGASRPQDVPEVSPEQIECLRIERGIPRWGKELDENTLPHEVGLETEAVDFHKGCYVGQEVVSRIQSVGRVNRCLTGFVGTFDPVPAAILTNNSGEPVGTLTSTLRVPGTDHSVALGFLPARVSDSVFLVADKSGACLGTAERSEFPLIS